MTRIVGGDWKSRVLATPPGRTTRPTGEKTRAALGNALQATGSLAGAAVLDLFAGSGALGLELLSRGAVELVAVEHDKAALTALRRNIDALVGGDHRAVVVPGRLPDALARVGAARADTTRGFDVVVADPPYDLPDRTLTAVLSWLGPLLAPDADVVVERSRRAGEPAWPEPLEAVRTKRYGDTLLCYGRGAHLR